MMLWKGKHILFHIYIPLYFAYVEKNPVDNFVNYIIRCHAELSNIFFKVDTLRTFVNIWFE